ncbi:MAG: Na+/H+ antiporter NhaA [Armatimonadetes bacterium]|nr:Na+/H+ antiporter NhaA [Armatimonadota bacterium]
MPARRLRRILQPFQQFVRIEAFSGIVLLAATLAALVWANSPAAGLYHQVLDLEVVAGAGSLRLAKPLHLWVNDGLMAVFFFLVGLEIKREVIAGELATPRKAALPVAAALGGMVVPALIYASCNAGTAEARGWGVPMATDIAFALGVLTLAGPRVPFALKVFLTALAIVDDIGAVAVIALFYSHGISLPVLLAGVGLLGLSLGANRAGVRSPLAYTLIGIAAWLAFLQSGVHATVAGVLLAFTVPAATRIDRNDFRDRVAESLAELGCGGSAGPGLDTQEQAAVYALERACEEVQTPLQRMQHALHPWVSYGIMPLFALANAGVSFAGLSASGHVGVPLGVILGLMLGKPIGITLFSWLAVRLKVAELPGDVTWRQLHAAGWLGGIGFTMAVFIAGLAFADAALLATAKVAILCASTLAGVVGYTLVRRAGRANTVTADTAVADATAP